MSKPLTAADMRAFSDLLTDWSKEKPARPPGILPVFVDVEAGAFAVADYAFTLWWWAEGNGSCDCNRECLFVTDEEDEAGETGFCKDALRYVAIDLAGEHANHPAKAAILQYINESYPDEVVERAKAFPRA